MSECTSLKEFNAKFAANQNITGMGVEGTTMHVPCPFCAEPDWLMHTIIETADAYSRGALCKHCGRGARAIIERHAMGGINFRMVQTGGPDIADFLPPMERE